MADISKIALPNEASYDIKDLVSRGRFDVRTGTGTAGQAGSSSKAYIPAKWTFNLNMTPSAGDIITIKIPVAGIASGVWLSVNGGTTYYPIAVNGKTRLTTQYAINNNVTLIYQTGLTTTIYGTDETGAPKGASAADYQCDRWCVLNYYDANTTYSAMTAAEMETGTATTARSMSAANTKAGLQAVLKATDGDVQLYGAHLTGQVPAPSAANNGKIVKIVNGLYSLENEASGLPSVSSSDNGKFLRVVNGVWAAATVASANGVDF